MEFTFTASLTYKTILKLDNTDHKFDQGTVTRVALVSQMRKLRNGCVCSGSSVLHGSKLIVTGGLRYDSFVADPSDDGYTNE
ncbi:hypothetical protein O9992_28735 [Vibrio lentus]|nr:hypothetical protein [Vibrio lentus]